MKEADLCSPGFHSSKSVTGLEVCTVHHSPTHYCLGWGVGGVTVSHLIFSTFLFVLCLHFPSSPLLSSLSPCQGIISPLTRTPQFIPSKSQVSMVPSLPSQSHF